MNRRNFLQTGILVGAGIFCGSRVAFAAKGKIGNLSDAEFLKITSEAGAKVKAIEPTSAKLSAADEALLTQIANGGMLQLSMSQAALSILQDPDVKTYAQGETDEQTILGEKLKQLAQEKDAQLPTTLSSADQQKVDALRQLSGTELNRTYLQETGVQGHELLERTMTKVEKDASDPTLRKLAETTLPLIRIHLHTAQTALANSSRAA